MLTICSASPRLRAVAVMFLACSAWIVTGCGSGTPAPTTTVTVTPSPTSGSSSASGSPTTPPAGAGVPECSTSALRVSAGTQQGAAGTVFYNVDFTNVSGATCFLRGYPGVSLVTAGSGAGSQIGADAKRDPAVPAATILVTAGQIAHAVLAIVEADNFPASRCDPVTAHWLKVFPPDQTAAAYVSFTTRTCASKALPTMRITTISAGS